MIMIVINVFLLLLINNIYIVKNIEEKQHYIDNILIIFEQALEFNVTS